MLKNFVKNAIYPLDGVFVYAPKSVLLN